jgi:hypothetical protein
LRQKGVQHGTTPQHEKQESARFAGAFCKMTV